MQSKINKKGRKQIIGTSSRFWEENIIIYLSNYNLLQTYKKLDKIDLDELNE